MARQNVIPALLAASVLMTGFAGAFNYAPSAQAITSVEELSDVDSSSWAYDALKDLVEKYNVIEGYPDKTFRGDHKATRYEMAAALNSLIRAVGKDIARLGAEKADKADLAKLAKLQEEFKTELQALQARTAALEERAAKIEAKNEEQDNRLTVLEKLKIHGDVVVGGFADMGGNGGSGYVPQGQFKGGLGALNLPVPGVVNAGVATTNDGLSDAISAIGRVRINLDYPIVEDEDGVGVVGEGNIHTRIIGAYGRVSPMLSGLDQNSYFATGDATNGSGMLSGVTRVASDASVFNEGVRASNNQFGQVVGGSNTRANVYVESAYYTQEFREGLPFVTDFLPGTQLLPEGDDWKTTFKLSAGLMPWRDVFQKSPYAGDETQQFQNTSLVNNAALPVNTVSPMITGEWHQGLGEWNSFDVKAGLSAIDVSDAAGLLGITYEGSWNYNFGWLTDWLDKPGNIYAGGFHIEGRGGSNSLVTGTTGLRGTLPAGAFPPGLNTFTGLPTALLAGAYVPNYDTIKNLPIPENYIQALRFGGGFAPSPTFGVADDDDNVNGFYVGMNQEIHRGAGVFFNYGVIDTGIQSTITSALQNGTGRNTLFNGVSGTRANVNGNALYGVKQALSFGTEIPMKALHLPWRHEDVLGIGYSMLTPNDAFQTSYTGAIPPIDRPALNALLTNVTGSTSLDTTTPAGFTNVNLISAILAAGGGITPVNQGTVKIDGGTRQLINDIVAANPALFAGVPQLQDNSSNEHVIEAYYNVHVNDRFSITPSVQFIINRLGDNRNDLNTVIGLRSTFTF